ncbi:MAG: hypothetical protein P3B76_12230 [Gemmatimonadota bacterium]|nr:hypothetical protein [Gemmatimonadota bacterium]MDQ8173442.1 hypothetical protein [Gemmatimonadota bacterium]
MRFSFSSWSIWVLVSAGVVALTPLHSVRAQVTVAGRVKIQEKSNGSTNDLRNSVVALVPLGGGGGRARDTTVSVAMDGRVFAPHVVVVTPGSSVRYPHGDPFGHNVFSTERGGSFDLGIYPSGSGRNTVFQKLGIFAVYCNIHPMMTSYVVVVDTPYRTQPAPDGRWSLAGVPPGRYALRVWHERTGEVTREVEVTAEMLPLDIELDARGYKAVAHKNKFGQDYTSAGVRY